MKHTLPALTALLLAGLAVQTPLHAADPKPAAAKPVATVNGTPIPAARATALLNEQKAQGGQDNEEMRKMIAEELIRREILTQESIKKGNAKKPEVISQIELARQALLIRAYVQDYIKSHPVADAAVQTEYDGIVKSLGDKEYKTRHVLVEKEDEAKALIARLQKGEKIEDLAKDSKDPGSKDRGGDLGWASPSSYVKPFSEALVKLEKGKFSATPVKTDFGYHVIMLEDTRPMKHPSLDEVKPQIAQRLQQQMVEKHVLELRAKAKVE